MPWSTDIGIGAPGRLGDGSLPALALPEGIRRASRITPALLMTPNRPGPANLAAAAHECEWFLLLQGDEASEEETAAFVEWLRRSPSHVEEFLQLTALYSALKRLFEFENVDVVDLLDCHDHRGLQDNLAVLPGHPTPIIQDMSLREDAVGNGQRLTINMLGAGAAVAVIFLGIWFVATVLFGRERYQTDIGEQIATTFFDGSYMSLNAHSTLTARISGTARDLELHEGQALFRVAPSAVPFKVHTREATIEARGTQFDVDVTEEATVVSLIEGHVLITRHASSILLSPDEQVSIPFHGNGALMARKADMKSVTAWTEHRLVFDDVSLSTAIAHFNRHSRRPFVIRDPDLSELRITATFDSDRAESFAAALAAAAPLQVSLQRNSYLVEQK